MSATAQIDSTGTSIYSRDQGYEIRERLQQLTYIVNHVRELETKAQVAFARIQNAFKAHIDATKASGVSFESALQVITRVSVEFV